MALQRFDAGTSGSSSSSSYDDASSSASSSPEPAAKKAKTQDNPTRSLWWNQLQSLEIDDSSSLTAEVICGK